MTKSKKRRLSDKKNKSPKQVRKKEKKPACIISYDKSNSKAINAFFQPSSCATFAIKSISVIAREIIIDQVKEPVWNLLLFIWHLFF